MKNLFNLNVLLLLIWVLTIIIDPVYSFLGFVIHGFIQVGMSLVMIFNNNFYNWHSSKNRTLCDRLIDGNHSIFLFHL